jgi:hypothetical protein
VTAGKNTFDTGTDLSDKYTTIGTFMNFIINSTINQIVQIVDAISDKVHKNLKFNFYEILKKKIKIY